jgi:hypothetical protein
MSEVIKVSAKAKSKAKVKGGKGKAKSKASASIVVKIGRDGKKKRQSPSQPRPPKPPQQIIINNSIAPPPPLSDVILAAQASKPSPPFQGVSQAMPYMPTSTQFQGDIPTASTFGAPTTNRQNQINNLRQDAENDFEDLRQHARAEFPQEDLDRFNEGLQRARESMQNLYNNASQAPSSVPLSSTGIPTNLFGQSPAINFINNPVYNNPQEATAQQDPNTDQVMAQAPSPPNTMQTGINTDAQNTMTTGINATPDIMTTGINATPDTMTTGVNTSPPATPTSSTSSTSSNETMSDGSSSSSSANGPPPPPIDNSSQGSNTLDINSEGSQPPTPPSNWGESSGSSSSVNEPPKLPPINTVRDIVKGFESLTNTPSTNGNTSQAQSQGSVNFNPRPPLTPSSIASNSPTASIPSAGSYNPIAPPDDPPSVNLFNEISILFNEISITEGVGENSEGDTEVVQDPTFSIMSSTPLSESVRNTEIVPEENESVRNTEIVPEQNESVGDTEIAPEENESVGDTEIAPDDPNVASTSTAPTTRKGQGRPRTKVYTPEEELKAKKRNEKAKTKRNMEYNNRVIPLLEEEVRQMEDREKKDKGKK